MRFVGLRNWWRLVSALKSGRPRRPSRDVRPRSAGRGCWKRVESRLVPTVTLSVATPVPFPEGDFGTTNMLFVVTRSGDLPPAVQVNYTTVNGTAIAGTDYVATSGTLSFAANQTTATIAVPIIGNTLLQSNRTFTVSLSNPLPSKAFAAQQTSPAASLLLLWLSRISSATACPIWSWPTKTRIPYPCCSTQRLRGDYAQLCCSANLHQRGFLSPWR